MTICGSHIDYEVQRGAINGGAPMQPSQHARTKGTWPRGVMLGAGVAYLPEVHIREVD